MVSSRPTRVLVAYSLAATYVSATLDFLLSISKLPGYEVRYVHVTHGATIDFDLNEYDVLFHSYCARLCFEGYVSESYQSAVVRFRGLKIIAVQDEYDNTASLHAAIRKLGFHVLLSCIQPEFLPLVHPRSELPGVSIFHVLTGYVSERLLHRSFDVRPLSERTTLVAYRGRDIGAKYGRLGFEKYEIGRRMLQECAQAGIVCDIAMDEASRIYGDAWFDFVGSGRTMLGSESGSNVFDFDGGLSAAIDRFVKQNRRPPQYGELQDIIAPIEKWFDVGQISPRVFECALMRTPMILFRGSYSNAIEADVHYIALEKDFSNAQDILSRLDDIAYLQGFADRAYDKLVGSGEYSYSVFSRRLKDIIEEQFSIWIDQNWIELRRQTDQFWPRTDIQKSPATQKGRYSEQPSELPLSSREEFYLRAASSGYLGGQQLGGRLVKAASKLRVSETRLTWLIRAVWSRLPVRVRYWILRHQLAR